MRTGAVLLDTGMEEPKTWIVMQSKEWQGSTGPPSIALLFTGSHGLLGTPGFSGLPCVPSSPSISGLMDLRWPSMWSKLRFSIMSTCGEKRRGLGCSPPRKARATVQSEGRELTIMYLMGLVLAAAAKPNREKKARSIAPPSFFFSMRTRF
jgi:hypothetical protein